MRHIDLSPDELIEKFSNVEAYPRAAILDSSGVGHLGSHLMIACGELAESVELKDAEIDQTLELLDQKLSADKAAIFTLSYNFGARMLGIETVPDRDGPDVYIATFDEIFVHDYTSRTTFKSGPSLLSGSQPVLRTGSTDGQLAHAPTHRSSDKADYMASIEEIKELIRDGYTYQTNLTHQISVELPDELSSDIIFRRLRRDHPAPFAAFIRRGDSTVVSASPERFFRIDGRSVSTSPIKGTRPRGKSAEEDGELRRELLESEKDRAENTMIVDLLRNDLGRVCEYGSVEVEKLCDLEEHPTLFHLVSTIRGELRDDVKFSDVLRSLFPCGSITGAPKISTMKIIEEIEPASRGLSMGAIGYYIPRSVSEEFATIDLSVAIRTMVVRDRLATFNVGGGITIDSDPESEWDETWTKAKALLSTFNLL